jgi:hypothetical protein
MATLGHRGCSTPLRGALAGLVGAIVLTAFERLEWRLLRRRPVYAPTPVGERLIRRWLGSRAALPVAGYLLRAVYGPMLTVALLERGGTRAHALRRGLRFGLAIYLFELGAMPAVGATPRLSAWPAGERWMLLLHTTAFGLSTALASEALARVAPCHDGAGRHA